MFLLPLHANNLCRPLVWPAMFVRALTEAEEYIRNRNPKLVRFWSLAQLGSFWQRPPCMVQLCTSQTLTSPWYLTAKTHIIYRCLAGPVAIITERGLARPERELLLDSTFTYCNLVRTE